MRWFGRSLGGGLKEAPQGDLPATVKVETRQQTLAARISELSASGVRLRASRQPDVGETVSVHLDCVRAFGVVIWARGREFGVEFDPPLPSFELARLQRDVRVARLKSSAACVN